MRAAFYGLGVLLYLVRAGLHERVRFIASVSGGSIVNAVIASWGDFSKATPEAFEELVARLSKPMANRGVFFWPGLRRALFAVSAFLLWSPSFQLMLIAAGVWAGGWSWRFFWLGHLLYAVPMTVWFVMSIVFGRRRRQINVYASFIADAVATDRAARRRASKRRLTDFVESRVCHVLCATELTSGAPVYMTGDMIHSSVYGAGEPKLPVAEAVYASAAFPIGFPPLRVDPEDLGMSGGLAEDRPAKLVLSDGGVFNNLGTDSFTAWDELRASPLAADLVPKLPTAPDRFIVVNASSPPAITGLSNTPVWRNIVAVRRIMAVLYENTLRPRVQALLEATGEGRPIVIDIADSPIELATRMKAHDANGRADAVLEALRRDRKDAAWHEFAKRASSTKTLLARIGVTPAVRLLRLGYLNAAIACHIRFGTPGVDSVPSEQWFRQLVSSR